MCHMTLVQAELTFVCSLLPANFSYLQEKSNMQQSS